MVRSLVPCLLVLLVAVLATSPALDGGFVYDDAPYLLENPAVAGEGPWLTAPLGDALQGLWRPLTVASWRLQWDGPEAPGPLRAGNLVLHALVSLLVLGLGRRLGLPPAGALVGALVFAAHPVHAEAVAWITGRAELLATAFVLVAWWAWLGRGWGSAALSALAVVAASLSKENALAAPALFVLADLLRGRGLRLDRLGLVAAAVAASFAARLGLLEHALPAEGPYHELSLGGRLVVAANVLGRALLLLVWPASLRVEYHRSEFVAPDPAALAALAAALGLTLLLWRRQRLAAVALVLVPVALLPVLHLLPIGEPFAERFLYLPSVPLCLAAGALFAAWARVDLARDGRLGPSVVALLTVLALAVPASRGAVAAFHDDRSLWEQAVRAAPDSAVAWYTLGDFLDREQRHLAEDVDRPGSQDALRRSLTLAPQHVYSAFAHQTLGNHALGSRGGPANPPAAAWHFRQALDRMPGLADAAINLAALSLEHPALVDPIEGTTLLLPLRSRDDLSDGQRQALEELWPQLSAAASAAAGGGSSSGSDGTTGTSSPDGS